MELSRRERRRLKKEMKKKGYQQEASKEKRKSTMKTVAYVIIAVVIIGAAGFGFSSYTGYVISQPGQYDEFAQCLSDKGMKMYGAYWCSNCQRQKILFGNSFKLVDSIECAEGDPEGKANPQACIDAGISGYPTWIYENQRYTGTQSLEKLGEITGCQL